MKHRNKRRVFCWIFIWSHLQLVLSEDVSPTDGGFIHSSNDNPISKDLHGLFSPRMDYDQWKPLGRGDPLKNDPTYDYVPPVLDRVHYWIDPALRTPDPPVPGENQKTEILLLGVSSKKPSTGTSFADSRNDNYDSFLKFVEGPKFTNQRNTRPHFPMTSPYFTSNYYTKQNSFLHDEQKVPSTVLVPPPIVTRKPSTTFATTRPDTVTTTMDPVTVTSTTEAVTTKSDADITVQTANLVYQSSSLGDWKTTEASTPSPLTPSTEKFQPFNEDVIFQKHLQPPEPFIQILFAPNLTNIVTASSDHEINYVTPPPLNQEIMHKGQVSDDNLDISNTYVKIGKTEAQVHSTGLDNIPIMIQPTSITGFSPMMSLMTPVTMQTLQTMQSMQPPPVTSTPLFKKTTNPVLAALEKEKTNDVETATQSIYVTTVAPTTESLVKPYKQTTDSMRGPLYLIIQGHSKVKTYGPSKQFYGIRVQETNEISDEKDDDYRKKEEDKVLRRGRSGDLQTLKHVIQTRLGAIDFSDVEGVKETELRFGYEVAENATTEKYHKGIVEEARKLQLEA